MTDQDVRERVGPPQRWYLGTVERGGGGIDHQINAAVELQDGESETIREAASAFARLTRRPTLQLVERNLSELEARVAFYVEMFGVESRGRAIGPADAGFNVMVDIANWLMSFRLFLDHQQTDVSRRYGADSSEIAELLAVRNSVFDSNGEYRFIYRFRNFVQHCGLPLSKVSGSQQQAGGPRTIEFLLDREDLLASFDWTTARSFLEALPDEFDILPIVRTATSGLRTIAHEGLRQDLAAALSLLPDVKRSLERLDPEAAGPALLRIVDHGGGSLTFTPHMLPTSGDVARFEQAAAKSDPLTELVGPVQPPEAPPLSGEAAYRVLRGFEVMASWFQHGRVNEDFVAVVNGALAEDGHPEPLISGLVQIAGYALALAGQAMGSEPEQVLGKFAENARTAMPVSGRRPTWEEVDGLWRPVE